MYAKNGIVYAGNDQKILHVNKAVPHGDYGLTLFFDDGSIRDFDGKKLLDAELFAPLRDPAVFHDFTIDHGVLTWLDGALDVAPEYLYKESTPKNDAEQRVGGCDRGKVYASKSRDRRARRELHTENRFQQWRNASFRCKAIHQGNMVRKAR